MAEASVHLTGIYGGGIAGFIATLAGAAWGIASVAVANGNSRRVAAGGTAADNGGHARVARYSPQFA